MIPVQPRRARGTYDCQFWTLDNKPLRFTFDYADTEGLLLALHNLPSIGSTAKEMTLEAQLEALGQQTDAAFRLFDRVNLEPPLSRNGEGGLDWEQMHPVDRNGLLIAIGQWSSVGKGAAAELASFPVQQEGSGARSEPGSALEAGPPAVGDSAVPDTQHRA